MIPKETKYFLKEIQISKYNPKGKEVGFIKSVKKVVEKNVLLTSKQSSWLQAIYRKSQNNNGYQSRSYV